MKRILILLALSIPLILVACGGNATPDPCSAENLPGEIAKVNKLMREFDDYSALASNTPQAQLVILIPEMQRILRDAEDQGVPACLANFKKLQLAHMNAVVQTLMAFMNSTDMNIIGTGIAQARELHGQYDIEMARLLGVTLAVQPTFTAQAVLPQGNPTGTFTPEANVIPSTVVQIATVTNPGPNIVNLRSAPGLDAAEAGALDVQASTTALGKSADEQWIMVEIPGQPGTTAWVYAPLVQLSVPGAQLPVVNP